MWVSKYYRTFPFAFTYHWLCVAILSHVDIQTLQVVLLKKMMLKTWSYETIFFVQLNVSLLHCFCVLFNSFAKLYTHFWPFTSTSGGKIILQTLVVVITATSVCKMIFSILQPLVFVITATSVCKMILPQMVFYEPRVKANYF